ncbi:MAG: hypothetical protein JW866_00560 [Ignavibacteriales bacterium]|nr:hypothetical protein [Ignavibacteriales bacterium]
MKKKSIIGVSLVLVILFILSSLTNVIGYQTVHSSNQKIIYEKMNRRELLFQIIIKMVNNKEIQKTFFNFQKNSDRLFKPGAGFSVFETPVFTKKQLRHMYIVGLLFLNTINKSKLSMMVEQYRIRNQDLQKEITNEIEKNETLSGMITQLAIIKCDCENQKIPSWNFPILCAFLFPLFIIGFGLYARYNLDNLLIIIIGIGSVLNCFWYGWTEPLLVHK